MACVARPHCDAKAAKELYESEACIALLVYRRQAYPENILLE